MSEYEFYVHRAGELINEQKFIEAEHICEQLLGADPDDPIVMMMLGTLHISIGKTGSAIILLQHAAEMKGDVLPGAWHNLGAACQIEGHKNRAREAFSKCLEVDPGHYESMAQIAGCYVNQGNPDSGIEWANKSLTIQDNPQARNHLALCLLEKGKWKEGWKHYSRRWEVPERAKFARDYGVPLWDGKPLDGTLVIHGEQGLGDEILYMSCFEDIRPLAKRIVIECADRLVTLFQRSFSVDCYPTEESLKAGAGQLDAYIPMGDLPGLCRNSDADFKRNKPFLVPAPERVAYWRSRMEAEGPGPYVGVAWHGGLKATHYQLRCPPLEHWKPVFEAPVTRISVQYTKDAGEIAKALGMPHWQHAIDDIDEHAALIKACDLIVSVNQTAVHMAGAMGTECWCITPSKPAWRYNLTGARMVWYPSVRQFRQIDDWQGVLNRVGRKLVDFRGLPRAEPRASCVA